MSTGSYRDHEPQIFDEAGQVIAEVLRVASAQAQEIRRSAEEAGERVRAEADRLSVESQARAAEALSHAEALGSAAAQAEADAHAALREADRTRQRAAEALRTAQEESAKLREETAQHNDAAVAKAEEQVVELLGQRQEAIAQLTSLRNVLDRMLSELVEDASGKGVDETSERPRENANPVCRDERPRSQRKLDDALWDERRPARLDDALWDERRPARIDTDARPGLGMRPGPGRRRPGSP